MTTAARLIVLLPCLGLVRGDVGDHWCKDDATLSTTLYCSARKLVDGTFALSLEDFYFSNVVGWSLVFFYHFVTFLRAYAKSQKKLMERESKTERGGVSQAQGRPAEQAGEELPFARFVEKSEIEFIARVCRLLGLNLLTYWCYFGAPLSKDRSPFKVFAASPFIHSVFIAFMDSTFIWSLRRQAEIFCFPLVDDWTGGNTDKTKMWELQTVYAMSKQSGKKMWLIWISQTVLFGIYVLVMNESSSFIEGKSNHDTLSWMLGVLVICAVGETQSGDAFQSVAWKKVFDVMTLESFPAVSHASGSPRSPRSDSSGGGCLPCASQCLSRCWGLSDTMCRIAPGVFLRGFAAWTVNSIYRQVLLNTTPVLLCTEGPMDFIKDILAIAFISQLDDTDNDDNEDDRRHMINKIKAICDDNCNGEGRFLQMFKEAKSGNRHIPNLEKKPEGADSDDETLEKLKDGDDAWKVFLDDIVDPDEAALLWLLTIEQDKHGSYYGCRAFWTDVGREGCRRCKRLLRCAPARAREPEADMPDSGYTSLP